MRDINSDIKTAIGPTMRIDIPNQQTIQTYDPKHLVTVHFGKLPITIEYPKGSSRSGYDVDGNQWQRRMHCHYGFVPKTSGEDSEEVDVYLGEHLSDHVYIVTQVRQDTGAFDEYKCMVGFRNVEEAKAMYLNHYPEGWKIGEIYESNIQNLKKKINDLKEMAKTLEPVAHLEAFASFLKKHAHRKGAETLYYQVQKRQMQHCERIIAMGRSVCPERLTFDALFPEHNPAIVRIPQ